MARQAARSPEAMDDRYLEVLSAVTSLLLRDAPPDEVCEAIFEKLRTVLQLDAYFHFRVTSDGMRLKLASCRGCPPERLPDIEYLEFGQAVCGTVAVRRESMYVPNIPQCLNDLTLFVHSIGITCYTCQPLMVNGSLLGTFSFGTRSRSEYTREELMLIQLVCDQVAVATARDVGREQQLKLERMVACGQTAAKIAHEINNPLAAVTNLLYLLDRMPLSDEAKRYVGIAQEQLGRVALITKQTLSFYRQPSIPQAVNLRSTTEEVVSISEMLASKKRVRLSVDVPRDLRVRAVDFELSQILTNLVTNAVYFSPKQETVRIEAVPQKEHVEVRVSDLGPGVSADNETKLFQPFFTTKGGKGNGLGLWISRELARRVGGDILLVPSRKGATFQLRLCYPS